MRINLFGMFLIASQSMKSFRIGYGLCAKLQIRNRFMLSSIPTTQFTEISKINVATSDALLNQIIWIPYVLPTTNQVVEVAEILNDEYFNECVEKGGPEPYGIVTWNSSLIMYEYITKRKDWFVSKRVCDLGCGTGLSTLAGLSVGASVMALDYNPDSLYLTKNTITRNKNGLPNCYSVEYRIFDMNDTTIAMPECDILLLSDIFYMDDIAIASAKRAHEAFCKNSDVIATDPGRSTASTFLNHLRELMTKTHPQIARHELQWKVDSSHGNYFELLH